MVLLNHVFEYAGLGKAEDYVVVDSKFFRPHEVPYLMGDSSKASKNLGWRPKYNVKKLAELMYDEDLALLKKEKK